MDNRHIKFEIDKAVEEAYRRGYSHGYAASINGLGDFDPNETQKKILVWRHDLSIMRGAPGTHFEHIQLSWTQEKTKIDEFGNVIFSDD